ncbi:MAG: peptidylprolyl isomerase [archaeon]
MKAKTIFLIGIVAAILLVSGCAQQAQQPGQNATGNVVITDNIDTNSNQNGVVKVAKVESGDAVKVEYVGTFPDTGEIFDKSEGRGPLEFTVDAGQMIPGFDEAVLGMKLNDEKTITIPPEKAYGEVDQNAIQWVSKNLMPQDLNIGIGTKLMAGAGRPVTVVDVNADSVKIDFNHPLAGKTLQFWIKVVDISKSTA